MSEGKQRFAVVRWVDYDRLQVFESGIDTLGEAKMAAMRGVAQPSMVIELHGMAQKSWTESSWYAAVQIASVSELVKE